MEVQLKVMAALIPPVVGWDVLGRIMQLIVEEKDVKGLLQPPRVPSNQPRTWTRRSKQLCRR